MARPTAAQRLGVQIGEVFNRTPEGDPATIKRVRAEGFGNTADLGVVELFRVYFSDRTSSLWLK